MTDTTAPKEYTVLSLSAGGYAQTSENLGVNLDGSVPFSVSAWVRFNGLCSKSDILAKDGVFAFGNMGNQLYVSIAGFPTVLSATQQGVLDNTSWHYVCATYTTDGTVRLYIDGYFNASSAVTGSGSSNSNPWVMGSDLEALVRNVMVYNVALDAQAVMDNMFGDPTGSTVVAWFDFAKNPPVDKGTSALPITLENHAAMETQYPALLLETTGYAQPIRDSTVNPGGLQTDAYTVQSWVFITNPALLTQTVFVNSDLETDSGMALYLTHDEASGNFKVNSMRGSSESEDDVLTSSGTIAAGEWVDVATTYDGTTLSIYINGQLDTSKAFGPTLVLQLESNLLIGAALSAGRPTGSAVFQGYISRVDVWSVALSAADVLKYMGDTPDPSADGISAIYDFRDVPARNSVSGNPIGLADGAHLDYQVSTDASSESLQVEPDAEYEQLPAEHLAELRTEAGLSISRFLKNDPGIFDRTLQAELDEGKKNVSLDEFAEFKKKVTAGWRKAERELSGDPLSARFHVTSHQIGGEHVLVGHYPRESRVLFRADAAAFDACTLWKVQLVIVAIGGALDAFFGLTTTLSSKAITFIVTKVLATPAIAVLLGAATITASTIFTVVKKTYDYGLFRELFNLIVTISFWAVLRILAKIVLILAGVGYADVIASLAATVILFIKTLTERPSSCDPLPKIDIGAVWFNYDPTSYSTSALNLRKNYTTAIDLPEWVQGETSPADAPAAYSISDTAGNTVSIKAKFFISTTSSYGAQIQATGGGILGAIDPITVNFVNGKTSPEYVTLPLNHINIAAGGITREDITWTWQYRATSTDPWTTIGTTSHRIYIVLTAPTLPWQQGASSASESQYPWTDALDYAYQWAQGKTTPVEVATAVTTTVNGSLGLTYDMHAGASVYTRTGSSIELTDFLTLLSGGAGLGHVVNCSDCSAIVATFANLLGCNLVESTMYKALSGRQPLGFDLTDIIAIGYSSWGCPNWGCSFSYHEVAWTAGGGYNDELFDACLHMNGSTNPWATPSGSTPKTLPTNVPFTTQSVPTPLPVSTPFSDSDYRERICANTPAGIGSCVPQGPWSYSNAGRRKLM